MRIGCDIRFPAFSEDQKTGLIHARACGMSFGEITSTFRQVYPNYKQLWGDPDASTGTE